METALITGVNGYIGSHVARALVRDGWRVIGFDLSSDNIADLKGGLGFEFCSVDITNPGSIPAVTKTADVIVHCAALVHKGSPDLSRNNYLKINSTGTRNILEALDSHKVKRVLFLSTVSVYGNLSEGMMPTENTALNPDDYYGESKVMAEDYVRHYSRDNGIYHTILRLTPVYGKSFLLNIHKRVYLPGELAFYRISDGRQSLSLCSINNVVDVSVISIKHPSFFDETFNTGDFQDYSINDLIFFFKDHYFQNKKPVIPVPGAVPFSLLKLVSLILPEKARYYTFQLRKVAKDTRYSLEKLQSTGTSLNWNLYNTFAD